MALNKTYETVHGVSANYHRVSSNHGGDNLKVEVYVDQDARDSGKPPVSILTDIDQPTEGIFSEENLKQNGKSYKVLAYDYLKTLDMYDGATDV